MLLLKIKNGNGKHRVWRKTPKSFLLHVDNEEIQIVPKSESEFKIQIIDKIKLGIRPKSVWTGARYDAATYGSKLLKSLFKKPPFSYPKSLFSTHDAIYCNRRG